MRFTNTTFKGIVGIFLGLSIFVLCSIFFQPTNVSAVPTKDQTPLESLERWLYYRGMRACLEDGLSSNSELSRGDVLKGFWDPKSDKKGFGYIGPSLDGANDNDGTVSCDDGSIWVRGATLFGFKDSVALLCAINRGLEKAGDGSRLTPNSKDDCEKSTSFDVVANGDWQEALTHALDETGQRPKFGIEDNKNYKAMLYLIGKRSLEVFCGSNVSLNNGLDSLTNDKNRADVHIVNSDGTITKSSETKRYYVLKGDRDEDSKVDDVYYNQGGDSNNAQDLRCHEMAKMTRDYSTDYAKWARDNPDEATKVENDLQTQTNPTSPGDEGTSCAIDGVGWIVCPLMNFMADLNDQAFEVIKGFLNVSPNFFADNGAKPAWDSFRNIANVAFIIAFLIIIYSQITGAGVTNYGLKRLLPKLIISAILVNISYYVCLIAVDISNIVGNSIYGLFKDIPVAAGGSNTTDVAGWKEVTGVILAGAAALGAALLLLLTLSSFALLAVLLVVVILIARQALIILLVVIAPLAFVAYLLPNTEQWFKKWWGLLSKLLLVYPIIGVIFGASFLASRIISNTASGGGDTSEMLQITALGVMAIPLFAVPFALKGALSATGSLGAKLGGGFDRAMGAAGKDSKDKFKRRSENIEAKMAAKGGALGAVGGFRNRRAFRRKSIEADTARLQDEALSEHVLGSSRYSTRQQAAAYHAVDKAWDENVKAHQALYSSKSAAPQQLLSDMEDKNLSQEQRAAAAGMLMKGSRGSQNEAIRSAVKMAQSGENVDGVQKQMAADMGSRKPMGLGAGAAAELARGKLGTNPQQPDEDKPPGTDSSYNFDNEIAKRAVGKVSAASIPDLDPDDLGEILKAASEGRIQGNDLKTLHENINTAISDERINTRIDDTARAYLDQIRATTQKDAQDAAFKSYVDGGNIQIR